jgi:hypothetical protein
VNALNRIFSLFISLSSLSAGLFLASAHPVAPLLVAVIFLGIFLLLLWQPRLGLLSLPVLLPILNFSPWTGWLIVDEFDLLVLAVVSAGYLRMSVDGSRRQFGGVYFLLLAMLVLLVTQGANALAVQDLNLFSGYTTPLNSLRVGKSLLWVVLLFPLIMEAGKGTAENQATSEFFGACLLGSCWVVLAVIWERAFYPGLLDFATPYRTVALFWEMHLGGAALDAYLVLIAPLLVWAWRAMVSLSGRLAIGAFVQFFSYVCLTTFSRGLFGAIAGSLLLLAALLLRHRMKSGQARPSFSLTGFFVVFLVVLEIMLVLGADSFMNKRLAASERDFGGRWQHWGQGIGLLKTPEEWLFGIGIGKLPAHLTQGEAGYVLPGAFHWDEGAGQRSMVITGPEGSIGENWTQNLGGLYALSQRVDLIPGQHYRFAVDVRSERNAAMLVQVCALHLLYPASCQSRQIRLNSGGWQHWESRLSGYSFQANAWQRAGHGVLLLSVLTPGAKIEVDNLHLSAGGSDLLNNGQFLEGAAGWFPSARSYFLPWHIDNLYLEILIETGLIGLFFFLAVVLLIVWRLFQAYLQGNALAPYFMSSIAGLMALGLVVSVLDMPRVATLFGLFLLWAWQCSEQRIGKIRSVI